eukprot:gene3602-3867_t
MRVIGLCTMHDTRKGWLCATPLQQWQGLIAVNYAARAAGVTRHMRVAEAIKICPELQLVHVQTIGRHPQQTAHQEQQLGRADQPAAAVSNLDTQHGNQCSTVSAAPAADGQSVEGSALDRGNAKACLQRYRRASADIMRLLGSLCPGCLLEKASIDEAYLDVRELAAAESSATHAIDDSDAAVLEGGLSGLMSQAAAGSVVLGEGGLQPDMEFDRLAAAGARVALRLRRELLAQLGFTASAGIAHNKLLAKIGSAKNKPNQQTLVLPRAVPDLMADLPLGKVKGLGGKLGSRLEQLGCRTAGAAAALPWEQVLACFDAKARWVHNTVRGIDDELVTPRDKVKSINSCKSFEPTSDPAVVRQWLDVLAAELADRMEEDSTDHHRHARSLVLQYRGEVQTSSSRDAGQSIRAAMPVFNPRDTPNAGVIAEAAFALFNKIGQKPLPLNRLALTATDSALLADVDIAEQARLIRDIEIKGLLQRHTTQHRAVGSCVHDKKRKQHAGGSDSSSSSRRAKKGALGDGASDKKQLNIAALLSGGKKT